jgi:hypothetical protein
MEPWLTTKQIAVLFGCTGGNVTKTITPHAPESARRKVKGVPQYHIPTLITAYTQHRIDQHDKKQRKTAAQSAAAGDEMLSGPPGLPEGSSPALEAYRVERAAMAKLERLEREQALLPRDAVHDALARVANILRGAGETLQRSYGPEAQAALDEALDDAENEIDALCGGPTDDSSNSENGDP